MKMSLSRPFLPQTRPSKTGTLVFLQTSEGYFGPLMTPMEALALADDLRATANLAINGISFLPTPEYQSEIEALIEPQRMKAVSL